MFDEDAVAAYVDGELDPTRAEALAAEARRSPELQRRIDAHRLLRERLSGAFGAALTEPVPDRLADTIRRPGAAILPFRRPVPATPARPRLGRRRIGPLAPLAACLVLGILGGAVLFGGGGGLPVQASPEGLEAEGPLAATLQTALASGPMTASGVAVGLTFKRADGVYCRTFSLAVAGSAGLACKSGRSWRVEVLAPIEREKGSEYRTAASGLPPTVLAEVERLSVGPALDRAQEVEARRRGWR